MSIAQKRVVCKSVWSVISRVLLQPSIYGRNGCLYYGAPQLWLILVVAQVSLVKANRMRIPAESFAGRLKGLAKAGKACRFRKELWSPDMLQGTHSRVRSTSRPSIRPCQTSESCPGSSVKICVLSELSSGSEAVQRGPYPH